MNIVERLKDSLEYEYNLSFSERKQLLEEIQRLNNIIDELNEDIYHLLNVIGDNKDDIKVTSDEELAIFSCQNRLEELKENNKDV